MSNAKKKMPRKTTRIDLKEEYEGYFIIFRTNPKIRIIESLGDGELSKVLDALSEIIVEWNLTDEDGNDLGDVTEESMREVPSDLIEIISKHFMESVAQLSPK